MPYEVKIPTVGESVTEVAIHQWLKKEGDHVEKDEPLAELETDKASVELPSPVAGRIAKLLKGSGDSAQVGEVIAHVEEDNGRPATEKERQQTPAKRQAEASPVTKAEPRPRTAGEQVPQPAHPPAPQPQRPLPAPPALAAGDRGERITPMTPIRRTIAKRLVQAQQTMALLTTFNEADMTQVMDLRRHHGEAFQQRHGVKLGFMSFFVRAVVAALKEIPALNCEIRDQHIVHRDYCDIGIAISTSYGLVVPVIRDAERLTFGEIEQAIVRFAQKAEAHQLDPDDLNGGTFTISNGGVFGSLLSTPIVNPPQSGVLGMHTIQERPVARDGQVVIRPMMYLALTYDHRIVDGRESVTFLKRVKQYIEDPALLTLET